MVYTGNEAQANVLYNKFYSSFEAGKYTETIFYLKEYLKII